jgi:hypothetical protein
MDGVEEWDSKTFTMKGDNCHATATDAVELARSNRFGSVANFAQGVMKGQLSLSVWELNGEGVEQFGHREALTSCLDRQLSFLEHVHEFNTS